MADKPEVFIVESLDLDDEVEDRFEGKILTEMLRLGGKKPLYFYVRTKRELEGVLRLFEKSEYRYLHLSCHGNDKSIFTTLDEISFRELGVLLAPYLEGCRLFVSSCEVVNEHLAEVVMPSGCVSIIGPRDEVLFSDAAIFWASFYHLAFSSNKKRMKRGEIKPILRQMARLFGVPVAYASQGNREFEILSKARDTVDKERGTGRP